MPQTIPAMQEDVADFLRTWSPTTIDKAAGLPAAFYTDPAVFALERQRFFARTWLFVAHVADLPATAGWHSVTMAGFPVLLTRDGDGRIRAFHNVCPHRGSPLGSIGDVTADCGVAKTITCPYHGWVFGLDGRLAGAPGMDQAPSFDRDQHRLREVRCDHWGPFLFVNIDGAAPPLAEQLGPAVALRRRATRPLGARASRRPRVCGELEVLRREQRRAEYYREPTAHHSSYNTK